MDVVRLRLQRSGQLDLYQRGGRPEVNPTVRERELGQSQSGGSSRRSRHGRALLFRGRTNRRTRPRAEAGKLLGVERPRRSEVRSWKVRRGKGDYTEGDRRE